MRIYPKILVLGAAVGFCAFVGSAFAHHSFAMFDNQKNVTVEGTVKDFKWANPHSWIEIVARDASGKDVQWSVEGGSPNTLLRQGWKPASMKAGDRASIIIHPLKDGTAGGSLVEASVNGQRVGK